jgi:hypothetical protein
VLFDSHNAFILANSLTCCQGILTSRLIRIWHETGTILRKRGRGADRIAF